MADMELGAADWVNASLAEALLAQQGVPLLVGAKLGCVAAVRVMTEIGASLEVRDAQGQHPLHAAAAGGHTTILGILLSAGANLEARDNEGNTPLLSAILHGQQAAVETLLAVGADMNAVRHDGLSVQEAALAPGVPHDILELVSMGVSKERLLATKLAMEQEANLNATTPSKTTPDAAPRHGLRLVENHSSSDSAQPPPEVP